MSHRYAAFGLLLIILSLLVGLVVLVLATGVGRHIRRSRSEHPQRPAGPDRNRDRNDDADEVERGPGRGISEDES